MTQEPVRCFWVDESQIYRDYHDKEWGYPVFNDTRLFEKICLEGFQSGLSWITILKKRENFRAGFKGFDITQFVGLLAPAKTDPAIISRLHQEAVKAVHSPEIIQRMGVEGGNELVGSSPAEFLEQIQRDLVLYAKLVKDANIKPQ